jgi:hypothetical protein
MMPYRRSAGMSPFQKLQLYHCEWWGNPGLAACSRSQSTGARSHRVLSISMTILRTASHCTIKSVISKTG